MQSWESPTFHYNFNIFDFIALYMICCRPDSSPWPGWCKIILAITISPKDYVVKAVCYKPAHTKYMESKLVQCRQMLLQYAALGNHATGFSPYAGMG